MIKNLIFCVSAYYHYLLSLIYSLQLRKHGYKTHIVFFSTNKYLFPRNDFWDSFYEFKRLNDRSLKALIFNKKKLLEEVKRREREYENMLRLFSSRETAVVNFTEYGVWNILFMRTAYQKGFKIILNEEGIGSYLTQNAFTKTLDALIVEKFWRKHLKFRQLVIDAPWNNHFGVKSLDLYFRLPENMVFRYVLNSSNLNVRRFRDKLSRVRLLDENNISTIKTEIVRNFFPEQDIRSNGKPECILYLTHFRFMNIFIELYKSILKLCSKSGINNIVIKPHPLNTDEEIRVLLDICRMIGIKYQFVTTNIPGEFLVFYYEPRLVISYASSVSWFVQSLPNTESIMVYQIKKSEYTKSIRNIEKFVDFGQTNIIIPKNEEELFDVLQKSNRNNEYSDNEKVLYDHESLVQFLDSLKE